MWCPATCNALAEALTSTAETEDFKVKFILGSPVGCLVLQQHDMNVTLSICTSFLVKQVYMYPLSILYLCC